MPIVRSDFSAPFFFQNNHLQTVYQTLFRKVKEVSYTRERITTSDDDFLDIDISTINSDKAFIVIHGLEGDSDSVYVRGMVRAANKRGWDGVAMNMRGCSGETNRKAETYHSGRTDDLQTLVEHLLSVKKYTTIGIAGFSLGGNLCLKYAGEMGTTIPGAVKGVVGISAPCDLAGAADELLKRKNQIYSRRFLKSLLLKMKEKTAVFPESFRPDYSSVRTLHDFDNTFTAPLNGFKDAQDYWYRASANRVIADTIVPTLIINAKDDPILSNGSFPYDIARSHDMLFLETPVQGGHVGFVNFNGDPEYWYEKRVFSFFECL